MYVRYVRNHFLWSKNFPFGHGNTKLVRNASFSKGPLQMVPKVHRSAEMLEENFFQTALPRELFRNSGIQEKRKKAWRQIRPPWVIKGPKYAGSNRVKLVSRILMF